MKADTSISTSPSSNSFISLLIAFVVAILLGLMVWTT